MQCFTDPELEAGEIPVRDPFGNPVPASLEHSKVRREAKKAKKKFQKQLSIDRSREAQAQLEAERLRSAGRSHFLAEANANNRDLSRRVLGYLRLEREAEEQVQRIVNSSAAQRGTDFSNTRIRKLLRRHKNHRRGHRFLLMFARFYRCTYGRRGSEERVV